jgi:hypothetical protein
MKASRASPLVGRNATRDRQRIGRSGAQSVRQRFPTLSSLQLDFDFSDASEFIPST